MVLGDNMIKVMLNNGLVNSLIVIEKNRTILENTRVPLELSNKFRKNTKKEVHMRQML